jgi:hypothetical protein
MQPLKKLTTKEAARQQIAQDQEHPSKPSGSQDGLRPDEPVDLDELPSLPSDSRKGSRPDKAWAPSGDFITEALPTS